MADAEPKVEMTRLGSYAIVRKLARGGMAELFLARSTGPEGFEKLVVLKKILPRYAENPRFVQLFLDEAKLAASFDDPRIVHVYDMGRVDGNYFFAMEYVHGQDLRSILRRTDRIKQVTPIEHAVLVARTVAGALHHAHERRRPDGTSRDIVHRDVSPSNILVSYDGAIKLADFGVAKAATSTTRTRTGTLKGKVGYMSPEQARGLPIDRRSDIFSLGVVLWELVAVRRLFKTDNDLATIQAIINNPPPALTKLRGDVPPELERIVNKALEKDPATRFQTAQAMQLELEELAREHKLTQSTVAMSRYVSGLFEPELSAWRDAQQAGSTVTEFISTSGPATPISESELSLDAPFAESGGEADEELEELDDDDDEHLEQTTLPPTSAAGAIVNDAALDEATAIAAPPIMVEPEDDKPREPTPPPPSPAPGPARVSGAGYPELARLPPPRPVVVPDTTFEQASTTVNANPFSEELQTTQMPSRFADEQATIPRETGITTVVAQPLMATPPTGMPNVMVTPQTPPGGIPVYPHASGQLPQQPQWGDLSNLTPQRRLIIFAAVAGALIILVVIVAIIAGGGEAGSLSDPAK